MTQVFEYGIKWACLKRPTSHYTTAEEPTNQANQSVQCSRHKSHMQELNRAATISRRDRLRRQQKKR